MEFKMNRNASGYYDETAYKAIQGMAKTGEIYECGHKVVLIIKNHGNHCTALTLLEQDSDNCTIIDSLNHKFYTDPSRVQYVYTNMLGQCVDVIEAESFKIVLEEIEYALGFYNLHEKELLRLNQRIRELEKQVIDLEAEKTETGDETIYKRLYEDIIDKLIDKKVL